MQCKLKGPRSVVKKGFWQAKKWSVLCQDKVGRSIPQWISVEQRQPLTCQANRGNELWPIMLNKTNQQPVRWKGWVFWKVKWEQCLVIPKGELFCKAKRDQWSVRLNRTSAVRPKGTSAVRSKGTSAVMSKRTVAVRPQGTSAVRPNWTSAVRPKGTSAVRPKGPVQSDQTEPVLSDQKGPVLSDQMDQCCHTKLDQCCQAKRNQYYVSPERNINISNHNTPYPIWAFILSNLRHNKRCIEFSQINVYCFLQIHY